MFEPAEGIEKLKKELDITFEEAMYILNNPCLESSELCSRWQIWREKYYKILNLSNIYRWIESFMFENCAACINLNGFLVMKTGPYERPRAVKKRMKVIKEKCDALYRFLKKKYNFEDV